MEQNDIIDKFIKELQAFISIKEKDYFKYKQIYEAGNFLRENLDSNNTDAYNSLVKLAKVLVLEKGEEYDENKSYDISAYECFSLLIVFDPNSKISLDELKEAFFTCQLASSNEVMKKFGRYQQAVKTLNSVKMVFIRHQFRKSEHNVYKLEDDLALINKYKNLLDFLMTGNLSDDLSNLEDYKQTSFNFSEEEWLDIYNYILMLQIKNYKKQEEVLIEKNNEALEEQLGTKAKELEDRILSSLPAEDVEVIKGKEIKESETNLIVEQELTKISDEKLLSRVKYIENKLKQYKNLGKISPTREQSFNFFFESLSSTNNFEFVKAAFSDEDYLKFIYYALNCEFNILKNDIESEYPVSEISEYISLLEESIDRLCKYVDILDNNLKTNAEALLEDNSLENKKYKLIFLEENGNEIIFKDIKKFSQEKMQDLANILIKMEDGRLENAIAINRNVNASLRSIRAKFVFVLFRPLNEDHLLVCTANDLKEFDATVDRFEYNTELETRLSKIIREKSSEYEQLMQKQDDIKVSLLGKSSSRGI